MTSFKALAIALAASLLASSADGKPLASRPRKVVGRATIPSTLSPSAHHHDVFSLHGRGILSTHLDSQSAISDDSIPIASVLAAELASSNSSSSNSSSSMNLTDPVGILGAGMSYVSFTNFVF